MPRLTLTKKCCVYVDYTSEIVPRPFYVGVGNQTRVNNPKRNQLHTRIARKYGMTRTIVFETDLKDEALKRERELVDELKTYDGWGANLTSGGEDSPMKDPVIAAKVSRTKMGHKVSVRTRKKIGIAVRKRHHEDPTIAYRSGSSMRGKKHTLDTREQMKRSHKNRKPISEASRKRIKRAAQKREALKKASGFVYHKHTPETKRMLSEMKKGIKRAA